MTDEPNSPKDSQDAIMVEVNTTEIVRFVVLPSAVVSAGEFSLIKVPQIKNFNVKQNSGSS